MALTFFSLGPIAFVLGLLIEGLGLAYDFRFKGTPVSAVLFAVYQRNRLSASVLRHGDESRSHTITGFALPGWNWRV